jgi:hypothetical protein
MKILQITESGYISDPKDFDPKNIEVQIKGYGVITLEQLKNKIKGHFQTLADKVDVMAPESLKYAFDESVLPHLINAYVDANDELNTPQMKRKATMARKQHSAEAYSAVAKHIAEGVPFCDSIFRHGSKAYFETIDLARELYRSGLIETDWESAEMLESDMGQQVNLKELGTVYLDTPYMVEDEEEEHQFFFVTVGTGRDSMVVKTRAKNRREAIKSQKMKYPDQRVRIETEENPHLEEAEYQGKKVELSKPKRGGSKKFYVYVKNPKTGKVKKVSFGAASGGGSLAVKLKDPKARKAFADRHNCDQKNDKTKPGYWSCRLPRYAKSLGLSGGGTWW